MDNPRQGGKWKTGAAALVALLVGIGISSLYHHVWGHPFSNPYPYIDPARQFIDQGNFIVNIQPLRERLAALSEEARIRGVELSVYFEYLNTGANINTNRELRVWPASLVKIPMAMIAMKKVEAGQWSLGQEMTITEEDRADHAFGTLWQSPAGTSLSLDELLRYMVAKSDNTAYLVVRRNISQADTRNILDELGLEELFDGNGLMSAKEYARIFRSLYTSSYLTPAGSQKLLALAQESEFKDYLAQPLPEGVPFAHKFGVDERRYAHLDAGIVYVPGRPYMLVAMVQGTGAPGEENVVEDLMHAVSRESYAYINSYKR